MSTATATEPVESIPTTVPASPTATMNAVDAASYLISSSWDRWQFAFSGATWADYQRLLDVRLVAGRKAVRITYSDGEVEIVTVGSIHERWKSVVSMLVKVYLLELGTPSICCGGMTISREDLDRGFEPDECFYLANAGKVLGLRELDFAADPPPDLAIEIEITRNIVSKLPAYSVFKVPEIWRFDGSALVCLPLQPNGTYSEVPDSKVLPSMPLSELVRFAKLAVTTDDTSLCHQFRDFVRTLPSAS